MATANLKDSQKKIYSLALGLITLGDPSALGLRNTKWTQWVGGLCQLYKSPTGEEAQLVPLTESEARCAQLGYRASGSLWSARKMGQPSESRLQGEGRIALQPYKPIPLVAMHPCIVGHVAQQFGDHYKSRPASSASRAFGNTTDVHLTFQ
jgi:hypothetical protein